MSKLNNQDIEVANYLKSIGIPYNAFFTGQNNDPNWEADTFKVTFQNESFSFSSGIGNRLTLVRSRLSIKDHKMIKRLKEEVFHDSSKKVVEAINGGKQAIIMPTSASVLYCLLSDAGAIDESFENWCDNFGYDNDSIEAFTTYTACCKIGKKIKKLFNSEQIETLQTILEDY